LLVELGGGGEHLVCPCPERRANSLTSAMPPECGLRNRPRAPRSLRMSDRIRTTRGDIPYGNWELTFRPNPEAASASIGTRGQCFEQGLPSPSIEFLEPVAAFGDPREQFGSAPLTIR